MQNATRARMLRQNDAYWRERQRDLDDLSDRLLRILAGRMTSADEPSALPPDTILVARTMGPAELLDYDRKRLRGLIVEDGSGQSHVAIVAKALGIAAVGQARGVVERVTAGDAAIVDATTGEVHLRPSTDVIAAYSDKVRFLARRQRQYRAAARRAGGHQGRRSKSTCTSMPVCSSTCRTWRNPAPTASGLFRTELHVHAVEHAAEARAADAIPTAPSLARADGKPVVFRTLDIGGDKVLPLPAPAEGREPGHGLAGHPHGARPAGAVAHAGARAAARCRGPGAAR